MTDHDRIPPGQYLTDHFPPLHYSEVPVFDPISWTLEVGGLIEEPVCWKWEEFIVRANSEEVSDFHCVTTWSRLDNHWKGLRFRDLAAMVRPLPAARFVTIEGADNYTTSLPQEDLLGDGIILATHWEQVPITPEHGAPLRLVVPHKYAYKAAKWVRKIRFTSGQEMGYWETRGYSNNADPWKEERFHN